MCRLVRGDLCSVDVSVGLLVVLLMDVDPRLRWRLHALVVVLACGGDSVWLAALDGSLAQRERSNICWNRAIQVPYDSVEECLQNNV